MSTYKCPECGNPIKMNERHCANCDYDVTDSEYAALVPAQPIAPEFEKPKAPQTVAPQKPTPASGIDSIMAHGSVDASSHNTHNEDKSTHNIDNSQTVNNTNQTVTNTFIIMGGGPAPMPQNIDPQTAEALKQAQAQQVAQQPVPPIFTAPAQSTTTEEGQKGLGSIDGRRPAHAESSKKWWIAVVAVAVVAIVAIMMIPEKEEETTSTQLTTAPAVAPKENKPNSTEKTTTTKPTAQKATAETVVATSTTNAQATAKTVDQNYESGMKAFKAGDGLAAIQAFKASGSKESLRMIGKIYEEGCGSVEANAMMARKYYKEAERK